jgi:hypothetical protein
MSRSKRFATEVGRKRIETGMRPVRSIVFRLFAEQISLFEAIDVLLTTDRHVEAIQLLERLLREHASWRS